MHKTYYRLCVCHRQRPTALLCQLLYRRDMFPIERGEWETAFRAFLLSCGFDEGYGYFNAQTYTGDVRYHVATAQNGMWYEDDVFIVRPYYWGNAGGEGRKPNFVYKPTGFEMHWYKYPLRDAYANKEVTLAQFKAMLEDCGKSWLGGCF